MTMVGVVGAGSWGTALAVHLSQSGTPTRLWCRRSELASEMRSERRNAAYLPGAVLPDELEITASLEEVVGCDPILVVVPSHGYRETVRDLMAVLPEGASTAIVSCTKGVETETLARMSEVTYAEAVAAGRSVGFAVLSGPTFAIELAASMPTAAVIAAKDLELAAQLQSTLSTSSFRLYSTDDVAGVEIGGTSKNVIAIAAGVASGVGLGHNSLAALITRGLHEVMRLGVACGGRTRTLAGLAGLGDLVLTCTGDLSRNRQTGLKLAGGRSLDEISSQTSMVAEGIRNSLAVQRLARREGVEMPITDQMEAVIYEGKDPREAVRELMSRELKAEAEL